MKQMTRRRTLSFWAACMVALSSPTTWAQTGKPVYIQGSEVNLRDKAATNAKVVAKVTIGTECQQVKSAPKQWVRLKCGDAEGFTLKSLVGAQKPTIEALLAQAQDATQAAKVRLDAAMRAATLDSENAQALKLVSDLFFDVSFEQLLKDRERNRRKGGFRERFRVMREVESSYPKLKRESGEAALLRELEKLDFDWHRIEFRDAGFVSAMYRGGELVVYAGGFGSINGQDELNDTDEEFLVAIESRSSSAVSEPLKRALQQGARTATPDFRKYDELHQESPDMPALSLEALRLFQSLPNRWLEISETEDGERFLRFGCGGLMGAELRVDLHRRASVWWHRLAGSGESNDEVLRVASIAKTATGFQFELSSRGGHSASLTVTWPTADANVSDWERKPHGGRKSYLAANTRHNFRIDRSECSETEM
ncbi:hypothetical protein JY651_42395 [Pyxidicoccus parkwayensis]|uniref:SH3b domain-containing protein n=1 Tax=Pyxidicoccus parkwayensis TaxID=2813578 RepID=A0ABX7NSQ5_9BACT|nr:hypothetical protein [Pyxidicoccus parkwaysis]QSQ21738.1 hypothetical protein JY651_42395 [Pyxidicoccus parkwaysis]